jgi:hypothetical protein
MKALTSYDSATVDAGRERAPPRGVPRQFPTQTVRDLIGIARLLYRTWRAANPGDTRLPELVAIGKDLRTSLTIAAATQPGSRRQRQAWEMAELATHRLGGILDAYVAVKPLIAATFQEVDESAVANETESKRIARRLRS